MYVCQSQVEPQIVCNSQAVHTECVNTQIGFGHACHLQGKFGMQCQRLSHASQVLRRPHEFKIRCLEDIRALFPSDWNPFYAGFGNRDTDEISYLTVGVPASKCFIINPKGGCLSGSLQCVSMLPDAVL